MVISPIISPTRETTPNAVGCTLVAMREILAHLVAALQAHGDRQLHDVNGLELFGPESLDCLPDGLHPNAEGHQRIARTFIEKVVQPFFQGLDEARA